LRIVSQNCSGLPPAGETPSFLQLDRAAASPAHSGPRYAASAAARPVRSIAVQIFVVF
jgi:hypothetical protein